MTSRIESYTARCIAVVQDASRFVERHRGKLRTVRFYPHHHRSVSKQAIWLSVTYEAGDNDYNRSIWEQIVPDWWGNALRGSDAKVSKVPK